MFGNAMFHARQNSALNYVFEYSDRPNVGWMLDEISVNVIQHKIMLDKTRKTF